MARERRLANCLGEENLAAAMDDLEKNGYEIEQVLFTGVVPIPIPADVISIGPEKDSGQLVSKYLVIAVKDDA